MAERPKDLIYAQDEKPPAVPLITIGFQHVAAICLAVVRVDITRRGLVRAPICRSPGVVVVVTVLGPLPNVPCHVVKAECVRRLRAHRMCLAMVAKKTFHFFAAGVSIEPGVDWSGSVVIAPVELSCRSGACSIFPLRFAGQPIRPVC